MLAMPRILLAVAMCGFLIGTVGCRLSFVYEIAIPISLVVVLLLVARHTT